MTGPAVITWTGTAGTALYDPNPSLKWVKFASVGTRDLILSSDVTFPEVLVVGGGGGGGGYWGGGGGGGGVGYNKYGTAVTAGV